MNKVATSGAITSVIKEEQFCSVRYQSGLIGHLYLLSSDLFRYYIDPKERYEKPKQSQADLAAQILAEGIDPCGSAGLAEAQITETTDGWQIATDKITISFAKSAGTMKVSRNGQVVLEEAQPITISAVGSVETLVNHSEDQYFGAGTQNGRFNLTHSSAVIANTNNWIDLGVASPAPFYWSTSGYGILRYTFAPGRYDFASRDNLVTTRHQEERFDAFYFFADDSYSLLQAYHELTGAPLLMPIYGFYEAHLNAYNRDYWVKTDRTDPDAIKYPDGNYYHEYQPSMLPENLRAQAVRENLNGEGGGIHYLLSARGMLDQYLIRDLPLGWFLPNDGYGAGYGQTDTLAGNLQNLQKFVDYANSQGVEVGLWTQQNLSPVDPAHPQTSDRDFAQELAVGVTALKTDMAWVGDGYSFGLNGTQLAANMIKQIKGDSLRPFIITMDGWAGTHNTAAVWTGDEKGGQWEYIRLQIPTYIGEGLSGQPNVGSDMDGIYYGGNRIVNTRDYQWKAFTPIQLNMDGWGTNPKNPFAFSDDITAINRAYLKQKTMLLPYIYSLAHQAVTESKPLVRAMFLEYPDDPICYSDQVKYQYLWGDNFLIAPIYQNTQADDLGNDLRNGIYLPDKKQIWIDYYTGKQYQGGQVLNNFAAPIWKLPVFVKAGAIVPTADATNTPREYLQNQQKRQLLIYPGTSQFTLYEDDGISLKYQSGERAITKISSTLTDSNLTIELGPTSGEYVGMPHSKLVELNVFTTQMPQQMTVQMNGQNIELRAAKDLADFQTATNVYYLDQDFWPNPYLRDTTSGIGQSFLRIKLAELPVTAAITVTIEGIEQASKIVNLLPTDKDLQVGAPDYLNQTTSRRVRLSWRPADEKFGRVTYNVEVDGLLYTNLKDPLLVLDELPVSGQHHFRVQTVTKNGLSSWSPAREF